MNLGSLFINSVKTRSRLINYQTVRWRRPKKPFWLGIARSKLFVVNERKELPLHEKTVVDDLESNYEFAVKSLLNFIRETNPKLEEERFLTEEGKVLPDPALETEILKSLENNAIWNAESARRREERIKLQKEEKLEETLKDMESKDEKFKKMMELCEEIVRKEKLLSKSFVTPENLDEAIENCLNNVENFDFAIDLKGNRYFGRESLTSQLNEETEEKMESRSV